MAFPGNQIDANTSSLLSRSCCDISVALHPRSIVILVLVVELNGINGQIFGSLVGEFK